MIDVIKNLMLASMASFFIISCLVGAAGIALCFVQWAIETVIDIFECTACRIRHIRNNNHSK